MPLLKTDPELELKIYKSVIKVADESVMSQTELQLRQTIKMISPDLQHIIFVFDSCLRKLLWGKKILKNLPKTYIDPSFHDFAAQRLPHPAIVHLSIHRLHIPPVIRIPRTCKLPSTSKRPRRHAHFLDFSGLCPFAIDFASITAVTF